MNTSQQNGYGTAARTRLLPAAGFMILLIVAASGWALSYTKLHAFGQDHLHFGFGLAWLVPVVYDLAPVGLSIVVYRARLQARSALLWRAGIWAFCGVSSWINWMTLEGSIREAQIVGALLPIAAVVLFEGIVNETHRRAQADLYGAAVVPRLTVACWLLDRKRTYRAFKTKTLRPLTAAEEALGIPTQADHPAPFTPTITVPGDGEQPGSEHPGHLPVLTTADQRAGQPVNASAHPPVHPPVQTGADQDGQGQASTPVNTPDEQDTAGVVNGSRLAPFNPLDRGPAAAREQGAHTRDRVAAAHAADPEASHSELAEQVGVSVSTVRRYRPTRVNGQPPALD